MSANGNLINKLFGRITAGADDVADGPATDPRKFSLKDADDGSHFLKLSSPGTAGSLGLHFVAKERQYTGGSMPWNGIV